MPTIVYVSPKLHPASHTPWYAQVRAPCVDALASVPVPVPVAVAVAVVVLVLPGAQDHKFVDSVSIKLSIAYRYVINSSIAYL